MRKLRTLTLWVNACHTQFIENDFFIKSVSTDEYVLLGSMPSFATKHQDKVFLVANNEVDIIAQITYFHTPKKDNVMKETLISYVDEMITEKQTKVNALVEKFKKFVFIKEV